MAAGEAIAECKSAQKVYPKFNSEHEGFAVLKEEVDELWEAVRLKQSDPLRAYKVHKEATQVAAMALRFLCDLCEPYRAYPGSPRIETELNK